MMFVRTPKEIGAAIRERRRALRLDQNALADLVGVSRQWVVEIEQGKTRAAVGLVLRTLDALGLKLGVDERKSGGRSPPATDIDAVVERARKRR